MTSADKSKSHLPGWLSCNYWLVCGLLALLLAGCGGGGRDAVKLSGATMGTTWTVTYLAGPGSPAPEAVHGALQERLDRVNTSMSTYRDDSEISRFNRAPAGQWFGVSGDFLAVLQTALAVGAHSDGAYDVTVAPLVDLWGFGPGAGEDRVPADSEIAALMPAVGQRFLEVDAAGQRLRKQRQVTVDFSSVAKGYAVDVLANYLQGQQIADFLVEVGGEMRLAGKSPRGDDWRIAVERPEPGAREPALALSLSDVAVATSGDYRNFFEMDGRRYSHSIDPRNGYPVAHDLVSVTVLAETAALADAWATALEVLGVEAAMAVASDRDLAVYFIRRQGDGFAASHTPAFAPYLEGAGGGATQAQGGQRAGPES